MLRVGANKSLPQTWIVQPRSLRTGDIIVSTTNDWVSKAIRYATGSTVSHAALYIGGGFIVEAVETGVHKIHSRAFVFADKSHVRVLRQKSATADVLEQASSTARRLVYRPYSKRNALATNLSPIRNAEDSGRFCSQVVAEAFITAGKHLCDKPAIVTTPADILNSTMLEDVSAIAVREIDPIAWSEVIATMDPQSFSADWPESSKWMKPSDYEHVVYEMFLNQREREGWVTRIPYHYFDLLRLLLELWQSDRALCNAIDDLVVKTMNFIRNRLFVLPRGIADQMLDRPVMWDIDGRGLSTTARREFDELLQDYYFGKEWNVSDHRAGVDEFNGAAVETGLAAISSASELIINDWIGAQKEYTALDWIVPRPPAL